jgi:hypothetical protein
MSTKKIERQITTPANRKPVAYSLLFPKVPKPKKGEVVKHQIIVPPKPKGKPKTVVHEIIGRA